MARLLRFIPDNATLVEVTTRTIQSRLLLTPTPQLNRIIIGALARAGRRYEVGVVAFAFLSNHFHLLVRVKDVEQLASFMGFFNSKLAREVVRLTGWKDKVWSRRYQATVVSNEEAAQTARLSYVLSNGVKEHLVARVSEWPGVHAAPALLAGTALEGIWVNRTAEYLAKQRGETKEPQDFEEPETLILEPLPCWEHLSSEQYRHQIECMVQEIEDTADAQRKRSGKQPLGPDAIRRQDPRTEPNRTKKSPAPRFHAFRKGARQELHRLYFEFVAAFREAADRLRSGDRHARFPIGSFPPHLPFVRAFPSAFLAPG
ncbi:MAG TPA: transposase [Thermoanaerobaculia bacterium]|jgi:REP element-mobilizing transposase RayT|nr:transposase [Thermoanaerobaculia bacterium]